MSVAEAESRREEDPAASWMTPGVRGIGTASLLADLGHEIPTSLLPSLLTSTLGAPAAALGVIEGVADGLAPEHLRGSAFGLLATVQSLGNFAASAIAGLLWALVSPTAAFLYAAGWMLVALITFLAARSH